MRNQAPANQTTARREALVQIVDFLAEHRRKRLARLAAEQGEQEEHARQEPKRKPKAPRGSD